MPVVNGLFPKFIYSDTLNISDAYNEEIKAEIYRMTNGVEKDEESVTDFHMNFRENILNNPVFVPLFAVIREHISTFCRSVGYSKKLHITDPWVSVTYPGQFHNFHNHGLAVMNGVYYVQAAHPMSLKFINPGSHLIENDHVEKLETKKLLLFDGSLIHGFTAVSEPKITIAFNIIS
jgi:uncharacterized protein (TIGR02466 family)